jgi:hypothetical protein
MADQEVIKHAKAAIDASLDKNKGWKDKFREILLEVGIIVFAVTLSIWLHGWQESLKDRKEEQEFLTGLKGDLKADLQEMEGDRQGNVNRYNDAKYFERVGNGEKLNPDSVRLYQWIFSSWTTISPRTSRFEALKGSGRLSIIEDKNLVIELTGLYTKDFPWIVDHNESTRQMIINTLMPYLAAHEQVDAQFNGTNWEELLRQSQMRILVREYELWMGDCVKSYDRGIEHCKKILVEMDRH